MICTFNQPHSWLPSKDMQLWNLPQIGQIRTSRARLHSTTLTVNAENVEISKFLRNFEDKLQVQGFDNHGVLKKRRFTCVCGNFKTSYLREFLLKLRDSKCKTHLIFISFSNFSTAARQDEKRAPRLTNLRLNAMKKQRQPFLKCTICCFWRALHILARGRDLIWKVYEN